MVVCFLEVVGNGDGDVLAQTERQVPSPGSRKLSDSPRGPALTARQRGRNLDPSNESLKALSLSLREVSARGEYGGALPRPAKEIETEVDQGAWFVHHARRDVDVDEHLPHGGTDGLKVSTPEHDTVADVSGLLRSKERTDVERVVRGRLHAYNDVKSLERSLSDRRQIQLWATYCDGGEDLVIVRLLTFQEALEDSGWMDELRYHRSHEEWYILGINLSNLCEDNFDRLPLSLRSSAR